MDGKEPAEEKEEQDEHEIIKRFSTVMMMRITMQAGAKKEEYTDFRIYSHLIRVNSSYQLGL